MDAGLGLPETSSKVAWVGLERGRSGWLRPRVSLNQKDQVWSGCGHSQTGIGP